jgi:hypothetical protein
MIFIHGWGWSSNTEKLTFDFNNRTSCKRELQHLHRGLNKRRVTHISRSDKEVRPTSWTLHRMLCHWLYDLAISLLHNSHDPAHDKLLAKRSISDSLFAHAVSHYQADQWSNYHLHSEPRSWGEILHFIVPSEDKVASCKRYATLTVPVSVRQYSHFNSNTRHQTYWVLNISASNYLLNSY